MPPCPGSSWLESLTPASRLNRDSAKSPTWPTTESTAAMTSARPRLRSTSERGNTHALKIGATNRAPSTPATAPDLVFPGLTTGESFGPPKVRPADIAAESHTHVTTSGKQTSHRPAQLRG